MWNFFKKSLLSNIVFMALIVLVGLGSYKMVSQALSLRGEYNDTETKIQGLLKKKAELEAYAAELESRQAIEREAKERLNLKLPGEEVVVVIPQKKPEITQQTASGFERTKSFFNSVFSW